MRSRWSQALRSPVGLASAGLLAAILVLALFAPAVWGDRATAMDTSQLLQGPSAAHWFGTDALGRDLFARALVASRLSVELALAATTIGVVTGLLLGAAPVLLGRRLGRLITAAVNMAVAFPGLLLALFLAVVFGVGTTGGLLAIGFAVAPAFARLTQTLVATVAERDFVAAARIAGVGRFRVLVRHILPNVGEPLVVNATIAAGSALLAFAGLSFLGLGVQPPQFDWGRLLGEGLSSIYVHPMAALGPGAAVVITGLAFNLFGEAIAKGLRTTERHDRLPPVGSPSRADVLDDNQPVLLVEELTVRFPGPTGPITPVRGISFSISRGEAVGVVGESGSGKSLTALALAQLVEDPGQVTAGRLEFLGTPLGADDGVERSLLGTRFGIVFQDPMTSFNPTQRVGAQLAEVARVHQGQDRATAWARAVDRLRLVRVPAAPQRAHQFPHELSGGLRQRAMIGLSVMGEPALIVADEPTTALDVTVQAQVLRLLADIRAAEGVALLLISHDITVVGQVCDRVLVMYAGRIVEDMPAVELRHRARHPYTRALLATVPDLETDRDRPLAVIPGRPADPADTPPGCPFAPRCPLADDHCRQVDPPLVPDNAGRRVACWHADVAAQPDPVNGARS